MHSLYTGSFIILPNKQIIRDEPAAGYYQTSSVLLEICSDDPNFYCDYTSDYHNIFFQEYNTSSLSQVSKETLIYNISILQIFNPNKIFGLCSQRSSDLIAKTVVPLQVNNLINKHFDRQIPISNIASKLITLQENQANKEFSRQIVNKFAKVIELQRIGFHQNEAKDTLTWLQRASSIKHGNYEYKSTKILRKIENDKHIKNSSELLGYYYSFGYEDMSTYGKIYFRDLMGDDVEFYHTTVRLNKDEESANYLEEITTDTVTKHICLQKNNTEQQIFVKENWINRAKININDNYKYWRTQSSNIKEPDFDYLENSSETIGKVYTQE